MDKEQYDQLIQLVRDAVIRDAALRKQYQVGDKFRFIRDQLQGLLSELESQQAVEQVSLDTPEISAPFADTDRLVYVYLFNAQGADLHSWLRLLTPKVFYEYSINRPIYAEKKHVEALIRTKANRAQHGFLTIAVNAGDILPFPAGASNIDSVGSPLIRVREGALQFEKLLTLCHNEYEYRLNADGQLEKRQ